MSVSNFQARSFSSPSELATFATTDVSVNVVVSVQFDSGAWWLFYY